MLIGLTGTKASGKGEFAEFLKQKGFCYISLSDMVREEAVKRGSPNYTITDLQKIGNELREKFGNGILAKRALDKIKEAKNKNFVIDGIRNLGEFEELRKRKDFVLIAVDAPPKIRFERLLKRGRFSDPKTYGDFLKMEKRDRRSEGNSGQQVDKCMKKADIKIYNDSDLENLMRKIKKVCGELKC